MQGLPQAQQRRSCKITTALMTDYLKQGEPSASRPAWAGSQKVTNPHDRLSRASAPVRRLSEALEVLGSPRRRRFEAPCSRPIVFKILEKSGNLWCQPDSRKGIKLGGCLHKQGVERINQHTNSWFGGHERCAVARYAAPPIPLGVSGCHFLQPPRSKTP